MVQVFKLVGPPGTGKTTALLSYLEKDLESYDFNDIAFVSFTKRGTYEGVSRVRKKYEIKEWWRELKYFRTLHSLCFRETKMQAANLMTGWAEKQFRELMGHAGETEFQRVYLQLAQLQSVNPDYFDALATQGKFDTEAVDLYIRMYKRFKKVNKIKDFNDLFTEYLEQGSPLPVKVAYIDEAQDLTPIHWQVARMLFADCEKIYLAGDADQSIYTWAGADVRQFVSVPADRILGKSYRLPRKIWEVADRVARQIRIRDKDQTFTDNGDLGEVRIVPNFDAVEYHPGESTFVLLRTFQSVRRVERDLWLRGIPYDGEKVKYPYKTLKNAIRYIKLAQQSQDPDATPGEQRVATEAVRKSRLFSPDYDPAKPWESQIKDTDLALYATQLLSKTNKLPSFPDIDIKSIHTAKGAEADHVVVYLGFTKAVEETYNIDPDSELRCLYVAVTRARKRLTIVLPQGHRGYPVKLLTEATLDV